MRPNSISTRPRRAASPWIAASLLALLLAACGGSTDTGDDGGSAGADAADGLAAADALAPDAAPADAAAPPDAGAADVPVGGADVRPANCPAACPTELCHPTTGRCLACTTNDDCLRGEWCRDGECVRTLCVPGEAACENVQVKLCAEDGMSYGAPEPCPDDEHCTLGECLPVICAPGEQHCEDLQVRECNAVGTGWLSSPCQPGAVCRGDEGCVPYRNTIVLIFDTSGSMDAAPFDLGGGACICPDDPTDPNDGCTSLPYPACEKPLCPRSKVGLSKYAFTQLFSIIPNDNLHFVLTRFPQRVSRSQGDCGDVFGTGHYQVSISAPSSDWITGDDDSHVTADGGWFDQYLHEILSVPFPQTEDEDTRAQVRQWMNFNEEVGPTAQSCVEDEECPAGYCDPATGGGSGVCWHHTDPELRATGNTPLGKSLFYAGEYIRKYVAIDGKPCAVDADCANVNHLCGPDGTCFDPLGHCRQVTVILFTDGVEEPASAATSFFNPRIQAKRLRYGLTCLSDADCGQGATCQAGICAGYPRPNQSGGSPPGAGDSNPPRLMSYRGQPMEVAVHVIDLGEGEGTDTNRLIADEGGGRYFSVQAGNPSELIDALRNVTDIKQSLVCVPTFPPGYEAGE